MNEEKLLFQWYEDIRHQTTNNNEMTSWKIDVIFSVVLEELTLTGVEYISVNLLR